MYSFNLSIRFKYKLKKFFKKHPDLKKIFEDKLIILQNTPFSNILKTHKLSGKLENFYSVYITFEYRLIINIKEKEKTIELFAIGTHDEVY